MYPSQVMKFTSLSEGQHDEQNGTITYLHDVVNDKEEEKGKHFS